MFAHELKKMLQNLVQILDIRIIYEHSVLIMQIHRLENVRIETFNFFIMKNKSNPEGHNPEGTLPGRDVTRNGTQPGKTQPVRGHNPEWDITRKGHNPEWNITRKRTQPGRDILFIQPGRLINQGGGVAHSASAYMLG